MTSREFYLTSGGIPFVVTPLLGTMRCCIPVVPGGDGADREPLEARTDRCSHRAEIMVGSAPTCTHHLAIAFRIAGIKPRPMPLDECPA
jgi:hypothetical protein